ncbi:hypothetical protein L1887_27696 [Cichorium endivia]|nr:hypothetical protein L1887_27696 [Cichorium endivia]
MGLQNLAIVLQATLSSNPAERRVVEESLNQLRGRSTGNIKKCHERTRIKQMELVFRKTLGFSLIGVDMILLPLVVMLMLIAVRTQVDTAIHPAQSSGLDYAKSSLLLRERRRFSPTRYFVDDVIAECCFDGFNFAHW